MVHKGREFHKFCYARRFPEFSIAGFGQLLPVNRHAILLFSLVEDHIKGGSMAGCFSCADLRVPGVLAVMFLVIAVGIPSVSAGPMFRSDAARTGVYDDGGERPAG